MAGVNGNVSFTEYADAFRSVKKIIAQWYSGSGDTNGQGWGTTANIYDGAIIMASYITANTPQNAYNIRVFDKDNTDILAGAGLARTNTVNVPVYTNYVGAVSASNLNFYVANANFNRNGTVI